MKRKIVWYLIIPFLGVCPLILPSCEDDTGKHSNPPAEISEIKHEGCKTEKSILNSKTDCFKYEVYNGNYLKINRVNVAFNCCIDLVLVQISEIRESTITITETESCSMPCYCNCLYDLEYVIGPLDYGTYTIQIVEQYADTMNIMIEFSAISAGEYCEERNNYPWN